MGGLTSFNTEAQRHRELHFRQDSQDEQDGEPPLYIFYISYTVNYPDSPPFSPPPLPLCASVSLCLCVKIPPYPLYILYIVCTVKFISRKDAENAERPPNPVNPV